MGLTVTDQPLCPSCACHRECQGFQKLAELKDAGLVVYCHNKRTKDVRQESTVDQTDTSQNVFILHNTKDVKLISADLKSELEKTDICCPRCRKAYQQVQKLMQKVTSIDRKKVMGLCDHCRKRAEKKKKTCSTCEEIVKKFMSVKGQQKEDTKQFIKIWLSKMGVYFKQPMKIDQQLLDEIAPGHKDTAEYLDLNLDQLPQKSSLPKHLPEVKEMFISEAHKPDSESNIDTNLQKRPKVQLVDVHPPTALSDMSLLRKPHEGEAKVPVSEPVFVQSDMTFMERHSRVNQQIKSSLKEKEEPKKYDDTLKHAKEAIKKRHDLSLRQMTQTEKEPLPRRPQVYEIPKVAPWEKDYDSKYYDESETDIKLKKAYVIRSQESLSVKDVQHEAARPTQKDLRDRQGKHKHHKIKKGTQDFDEGENITQELTDENELQTIHDRAKSKHRLPVHKTGHKKALGSKRTAENIAKTRFSFFFPKLPVEEKKPVIDTHSSHLIQLTQEKFRLQAEKEEENKRMRQEKKKQAQIEKEKMARYEYEQELARANAEKYLKDKESRKQSDTIQTTDKVEELEKIKKDLKVELEEKYGIDEQSGKAKRDSRSKPGQKGKDGKVDEISDKIKKDDQSKSEDIYETDKLSERAKKDIKSERDEKSAIGEEGEKAQKGIKSERDEKSAIGEVGEKAQKGIKSEGDEKSAISKVGEKAQKGIKSERDEKYAIGEFGEKAQKGIKSKQDDKFALGEVGEKAKKDVKSKHEEKYVSDKVSEKAKKDGKAGPDQIVGIDEKGEKTKRDTKSKYEQNAEFEKEGEKTKKDAIKAKSEQGKLDESGKVEKGLKSTPEKPVKLDGASQTTKKDLKISEAKGKGETSKEKGTKIGDLKEKDELKIKKDMRKKDNILEEAIKKDLQGRSDKRSKTEVSDKDKTEVSDKDKSKLKSKPDKKGKSGDADVLKKDVTSKSELKDKQHGGVDKEQAKRDALTQKQLEKQEHEDKIKREKEKKEDQERLKMVEQLHKDKESAKAQAAKDAGKELTAEEPGKKKGKKGAKKSEADKVSLIEIKASQKSLKATKSLDTHPKLSKGELLRIAKEKELEAKKNKAMAADAAEFRKLQEQLVKEKEKAYAARRADSQRRLKRLDVNAIFGTGAKRSERKRKISIKKRELKPFNVLKSVRVKPGLSPSQRRLPKNMDPQLMKEHRRHQLSGQKCPTCILCCDSELEMTFESYLIQLKKRVKHIIIGERIYKNKQMVEKEQEPKNVPMLFHTGVNKHIQAKTDKDALDDELDSESLKKKIVPVSSKKSLKTIETDPGRGIIRYALSDRSFIDKGWTMLPTEKVVRKMNVYRMRPAHPEFDWFEHNKNKRLMTYDSGERLAEFDDNGRGRWYYRNGRLALDYYDAQEANAQQRFVIYSSGEPDERGRTHPITILATFDYLGNGIVFDHSGKIRLKYNQTEGVVLDRGIGPVSHWKWHTLNDPPVLQQVMIDTQMAHKDPEIAKLGSVVDTRSRPDNEEMLAIEFDNFIKEKSKKLSQKFKPFQIKMKALKINENFSLKVLDQATIYLIYRDGSTNLKLNIGMILDHQEIVDTDTAEVGEVSNSLERFPARTDSLAGLQRSVAYAQHYERQRVGRDRRLRRPEPSASVDNLTAALAPPLRPPLLTVNGSSSGVEYCNCRKPANNLYYNTRLL